MADEPVFLYLAVYGNEDDARLDYDVLLELHAAGVVGTYDAALVTKDAEGKVHVHKREKPTQHGAWTGIGVGAVIGILFPPSIIASAAVAGTAGGVVGHLWRGMSRSDVKELGELLDSGEAGLIVIGRSKLEEALERELKRANRRIEKELKVEAKELEKELAAEGS
ncbi:MAG TPA: DUF1269 domain-containing protein [Conexibacter sp.]|nr:DUF1269 domain-containing protein [Conexibacter sp.]